MMPEAAFSSDRSRDPRIGLFETGLWVSLICAVAAGLLIDLVGHHLAVRMTFLVAILALVGIGCARSERAYTMLRERQWLAPVLTMIPGVALLAGNGRYNPTLVVVVGWLIAIAVPARRPAASSATAVVITAYVLGIVLRGEPVETCGSYGDLIALAAGAASVAATGLVVECLRRLETEAEDRMPPVPSDIVAEIDASMIGSRLVCEEPDADLVEQQITTLQEKLPRRQAETALGVMRGLSQGEIAEELGLKESTVREYEREARSRLGVKNREALAGKIWRLVNKRDDEAPEDPAPCHTPER